MLLIGLPYPCPWGWARLSEATVDRYTPLLPSQGNVFPQIMCCGNKPKLDGNLLHLERYQDNANTPQATLDFSYIGPKRVGYAYDTNGNITYDPLCCFEIRYNLNGSEGSF